MKWVPDIFLESKELPEHKADNVNAICEWLPRKCEILDVLQSFGLHGLLQG
jgi:hypothetical protein